jgi:hypothetical protein
MAGLDPAIHVFLLCGITRTWMPGTSPGMTTFECVNRDASQSVARSYCETVCTTLLSGRALTAGTFRSLTSSASYSGKVSSFSLAFISTTL